MRARWLGLVILLLQTLVARASEVSHAPVVQIAVSSVAGIGTTCALHADGAVSCWGSLDSNLDPWASATPVAVVPAGDTIQIALASLTRCLLRRSGEVACWGMLGGDHVTTTPAVVEMPPAAQISGPCARARDGHVACLGPGGHVALVAGIADATDVSARDDGGCAVRAGGQVVCWRQASDDPVGAGTAITGVAHAVQVATGDNFACARLVDGRVSCWGAEDEGQLGRGTFTTEGPGMRMRANPTKLLPPAPIATLHDVRAIAAGERYACALLADGTAACWGRQDASFVTLAGPTAVPGLAHVSALAVGPHACALRGEHEVACWGPGGSGELGTGWSRTMPTPRDVPGITDATSVSRTCALRTTGRVVCWGADAATRYLPPTEIPKLEHVVGLARPEADAHVYRITTVDTAGIVRELFDTSRKLAVPAAAAVATRCAVTRAGHVWCWPDTHVGAGGTTVVGPAREVPGITNAIAVADGSTHACVSRAGGAVTCLFGQPGLHRDQPRTIDAGGGADVRALGVGLRQDCVIRADRTVWCWDWDVSAIVQTAESPVVPDAPVIAPHAVGVTAAIALSVGWDHACAVRADGTAACWGQNNLGQLGTGSPHGYVEGGLAPAPVRGLTDAIAIDASFRSTCAVRRTGAVACWGDAERGAVGSYATRYVPAPVAVAWP